MSKLIRFDEDHFGYLLEHDISDREADEIGRMFAEAWPERKLIIMQADEFIDLTGRYEIVPIAEPV